MKNILVPTDFSATARNAAHYALHLAEQLCSLKVILYNAYQAPLMIDPMVPAVSLLDEAQLRNASNENLAAFKLTLEAFRPKNCVIETYCEYALLTNGLDAACEANNAGLIVMGITGGGLLEETLIGSNTVAVANHSQVPVIIVPRNTVFTPIRTIMLLSGFDKADTTIPVKAVRKMIADTGARLLVFTREGIPGEYSMTHSSGTPDQNDTLHGLLQDLNPEYHFSKNKHYSEAVNLFALEHQADLVITIPGKHGFFESLFTRNHTTELAFHTHVPLMVIHE